MPHRKGTAWVIQCVSGAYPGGSIALRHFMATCLCFSSSKLLRKVFIQKIFQRKFSRVQVSLLLYYFFIFFFVLATDLSLAFSSSQRLEANWRPCSGCHPRRDLSWMRISLPRLAKVAIGRA